MNRHSFPRVQIEHLALRALAGERVSMLVQGRRIVLTLDPVFRIRDASDGFLYLCCGLEGLQRRLETFVLPSEDRTSRSHSELGGARGPR